MNFCLTEDEKDYEFQLKSNALDKISIFQFKNFIRRQHSDENFVYELFSKCLILIKNHYKREFDSTKNELNFLIIDPIIQRCYHSEIFKELLIES
jgi:hypothetical protein